LINKGSKVSPQIFGEKIEALKSGLDYAAAKSRAISANIANIETPGFKRFKVVLDEKLGRANSSSHELATTNPGHIGNSSNEDAKPFKITKDDIGTMRADGNNVDIDHELSELSSNAIYFTALSRFISKNFAGLRSIISEGRK